MEKKKIRIGILLDSFFIESWRIHLLKKLLNEKDKYEVVLLVMHDIHETKRNQRSLKSRLHNIVFSLHYRFDRFFFRPTPDALQFKSSADLLKSIPIVRVLPKQGKFTDTFPSSSIEEIKAFHPDILIRFGFRILKGEILKVPEFGIWSFHHGDHNKFRGGPAGYWEVVKNEPLTGSMLQVLSEELDNGFVVQSSFSNTESLSISRNRNQVYWKSLDFILTGLNRLYQDPETFKKDMACPKPVSAYNREIFRTPSNLVALKWWIKVLFRHFKQKLSDFFYFQQWQLGFSFSRQLPDVSLRKFNLIVPPKDRFWADPFCIFEQGKWHVFFEELVYSSGKGHIAYFEIQKDGTYSSPVIVLKEDHHLSFPFVFFEQGCFYMIPESRSAGNICLYKCESFPFKWKLERVLMDDVSASDTVVHRIKGGWVMFTTITKNQGAPSTDELFMFTSSSLEGPWEPNAKNPVISDVRNARMGGAIFSHQGKLYRPGQICSPRYGFGISLREISKLNSTEFEEKELASVIPELDSSILGVHTISFTAGLTMTDFLVRRHRFW